MLHGIDPRKGAQILCGDWQWSAREHGHTTPWLSCPHTFPPISPHYPPFPPIFHWELSPMQPPPKPCCQSKPCFFDLFNPKISHFSIEHPKISHTFPSFPPIFRKSAHFEDKWVMLWKWPPPHFPPPFPPHFPPFPPIFPHSPPIFPGAGYITGTLLSILPSTWSGYS